MTADIRIEQGPVAHRASPLGGASHGHAATVALAECPFTPMVDLRVEPGTPAFAAVSKALDLKLPTIVGTSADSAATEACACDGASCCGTDGSCGTTALTLGPDWWLLVGPGEPTAALEPLRAEHHLSVVDVSAQRTAVHVSGPRARDVLGHVWEQDLRESHFPIGACSQGLMAKAPVVVWHCCADCYVVLVRASFARHLWSALTDATVEYL